MAEFAELGEVCEVEDCKMNDFLPFTCQACGKTFCLEHRQQEEHECENMGFGDMVAFQCPLCNKTIPMPASDDPNIVLEAHFATDCPQRAVEPKRPRHKCVVKGCRERIGPSSFYTCPVCMQETCLRHRYEDQHDCPGHPVVKEAKPASLKGRGTCPFCVSQFENVNQLLAHIAMRHPETNGASGRRKRRSFRSNTSSCGVS